MIASHKDDRAAQSNTHPTQQLPPRSLIVQSTSDETVRVQRAVALLKSGFYVIKYSSNQLRPNHRVVYLSEDELALKWKEPLSSFERSKSANKVGE